MTSVFDFGSQAAGRLSTMLRLEIFREAAQAGLPGLIFTFVYARGEDDGFIQQVLDAVEPHGGRVLFVLLKCEETELLRRVGQESRQGFGKLRDPEEVRQLCRRYDLMSTVPHRDSLVIDNTHLRPKEVARGIVDHFTL